MKQYCDFPLVTEEQKQKFSSIYQENLKNFTSEQYTYKANQYLQKLAKLFSAKFGQDQFSFFLILRELTKFLLLNELEIIFLGHLF